MAEMEGFEPPDGLTRQLISSQPRYDHFDTSPYSRYFIAYHAGRGNVNIGIFCFFGKLFRAARVLSFEDTKICKGGPR